MAQSVTEFQESLFHEKSETTFLEMKSEDIPKERFSPDFFQQFATTKDCWRLDETAELCQISPWNLHSNFEHLTIAVRHNNAGSASVSVKSIPSLMGIPELEYGKPLIDLLGKSWPGAQGGVQASAISVPNTWIYAALLYTDIDDVPPVARWPIESKLKDEASLLLITTKQRGEGSLWGIILNDPDPNQDRLVQLIRFVSENAGKFTSQNQRVRKQRQ